MVEVITKIGVEEKNEKYVVVKVKINIVKREFSRKLNWETTKKDAIHFTIKETDELKSRMETIQNI